MTYELDGIKTAMVVLVDDCFMGSCPCGWESRSWLKERRTEPGQELLASLRFHYTHCPKARGEET